MLNAATADAQTASFSSHQFIQLALDNQVLKFGEFVLKSGRISPYFFNAGSLYLGSDLNELSRYYAGAVMEHFGDHVDIIYGPAYKGIPLSVITAMGLSTHYEKEVSYCYNRKETKDHGEKGSLIGHVPKAGDRIVIVDDVITAGTAIREAMNFLNGIDSLNVIGGMVALDRQEKGIGEKSAIMEVEEDFGLSVKSIANLETLLSWTKDKQGFDAQLVDQISAYRDQYGVC